MYCSPNRMSSGLGTRDRNARQSTRCASGAFLTCYTQLSDRQKRLRNRQKSQYLARAHDRRSASCKLQGECSFSRLCSDVSEPIGFTVRPVLCDLGRVVPHARLLRAGWGPNARDPHYLRDSCYGAALERSSPSTAGFAKFVGVRHGAGRIRVAAGRVSSGNCHRDNRARRGTSLGSGCPR